MQPWTLRTIGLVFGAGVVALAVFRPRALGFAANAQEPVAPSAQATSQPAATATAPAPTLPPAAKPLQKDRFTRLADGSPVPALPPDAPNSVRFGVILIAYAGSELAEADAPSRSEAFSRASELIPQAREDFALAVKKGDRGSLANAGRIAQGVLEPAVESALFRLKTTEVSDPPIDTPRGFWVVRRHD